MDIFITRGVESVKSVMFTDINFVRDVFVNQSVFLNATFKILPTAFGAKQLLTLMTIKYDHLSHNSINNTFIKFVITSDLLDFLV